MIDASAITGRNGVAVTRIERDDDGRILTVTDVDGVTRYEHDASCQLTLTETLEGTHLWEYDKAGRLVREHASAGSAEYRYDAAEQLLERITSDGERTSYEYDRAGRRVREVGSNGVRRYEWDSRGWLTGISGTDSEQNLWVDALGELAEADGESATWDTAAVFPALTRLGDDAVFPAPGGMTGVGDAWTPAGWRPARASDNGDPWQLIGASAGARTHGIPDGLASSDGLGITAQGTLRLAGLEWMGARAYDPRTRGFLTIDPLQPVVGAGWAGNPYSYAGNDPLHQVDPHGLSPLTDTDIWNTKTGFDPITFLSGISTLLTWLGGPGAFMPDGGNAKHWDMPGWMKAIPPWVRTWFRRIPAVGAGVSLVLGIDALIKGDRWQALRHLVSAAGNAVGTRYWPVGLGALVWDLVWQYGPGWWEDTQKRWEDNPPSVKSRFSYLGAK